MRLQKTQGDILHSRAKIDVSTQSVKNQKTQTAQTANIKQTLPVTDIKTMSAALGLPPDKLSASIISFIRFFSLPLKKEFLTDIRRQADAQQLKSHNATNNFKAPVDKATGETSELSLLKTKTQPSQSQIALALTAAESKGVELDNESLMNYSSAIDPDARRERQPNEGKKHKRNNDDPSEQKNNITPLSPEEMKQTVLDAMDDYPLLKILNNLPDKNGRRWLVLPFEYDDNGKLLKVSLRFFLEQDKKTVKQMVLDIAEQNNKWIFLLNNDKNLRLSLYVEPYLSDKQLKALETELSRGLGIKRDLIKVRNRTADFPFEEGTEENSPLSVNEAV